MSSTVSNRADTARRRSEVGRSSPSCPPMNVHSRSRRSLPLYSSWRVWPLRRTSLYFKYRPLVNSTGCEHFAFILLAIPAGPNFHCMRYTQILCAAFGWITMPICIVCTILVLCSKKLKNLDGAAETISSNPAHKQICFLYTFFVTILSTKFVTFCIFSMRFIRYSSILWISAD